MLHVRNIRTLSPGFLIALCLSCAPRPPAGPQSGAAPRVGLHPCRFANHAAELLCGRYLVYENRLAGTSRKIGLNIVVIPALASKPAADPVFFLAGGPGQGAARIAAAREDALMRELRRERNLIYVDQRGSGDSHELQCAAAAIPSAPPTDFPEIFLDESIQACRASLDAKADLKQYTTVHAVDDLDELRAALGYQQINLYGISFGTLTALQYLRRYAPHVRAAALAGVSTPAARIPLHFARAAQTALDRLFEDCRMDAACRAAFPDLAEEFAAVLADLAAPLAIKLRRPASPESSTALLSRGVFVERLRLMLYSHNSARLIPLLIHRAANHDWSTFVKIASRPGTAAFRIALGMYLSVTCSESLAHIDESAIVNATSGTFLGDYRTRRHQQACRHWPRAEIPAEYYEAVASDVPVLMLSGEVDPATPVELGAGAARHLPNGRQIVLRNTPHDYSSDCARSLIVQFIAKGTTQDLDAACAARIRRPRFLTELPAR